MSAIRGDNKLRFDGQVAVVTGAGGGLGKTYALAFASRGAKVVVNDLGGSALGVGQDTRAADVVVQEIKNAGGIAVADYNSVEQGDKIIQTALGNFGRVDIVVNNAGILRDKSFARISDADWDLVHNVHLRGSFMVTRAAFPHMKKQNFGRIIMTSSGSGIYGNFGQANYSAAKLGLVGLCNSIAIEGKKYNIFCNTIAPMGGTRLTQNILPPDLFEELKPELVSPVVLWLCHKDCEDTGSLIEAAGGWFGKYRWERSKGFMCRNTLKESATPESVRDNWDDITDFTDADHLDNFNEDAGLIAMSLEELSAKSSKNPTLKPVSSSSLALKQVSSSASGKDGRLTAVGLTEKNVRFQYESKDVILYALGVGATTKNKTDLKYLYEGDGDFCCLPTFAIVPSQVSLLSTGFLLSLPNWNMDPSKLLHGEQYVEVFWPIPTSGTLRSDVTIVDVLDKGSGAVIIAEVNTWDESLHLVAKCQWVLFVVGDGNFNGPRQSSKLIPLGKTPQRKPDSISTFETSVDQASLYRLNGDFNPIHIDPNFAALGGFNQPILHGLSSFGIAAKAVLKNFCNDDVNRFKAIKARFAKPVIPGQTLITSMWKEYNKVYFETTVRETSEVCLSGGYVDITEGDVFDPPIAVIPKSHAILEDLAREVQKISHTIRWDRGVVLLIITIGGKPASYWTMNFENRPKILLEGLPANGRKPDSVLTLEDTTYLSIFKNETDFKKSYLNGDVKVRGSIVHFTLLNTLLTLKSKL